ncbi:MAG TPA: hypothetical protein VMZ71_17640 [Gemmataceae bacterium]|nr:hypothetical protein [Gemmataceae bacterium]
MTIRKLFAAAALSAGLVASQATPVLAAEKSKPAFGFSTLKAAPADAAKAKAEAWLKANNAFDKVAFDKVWANESRTVLDRVADSLALGNSEVASLLETARKPEAPAPASVPAILKDTKQDAFFRSNVAVAFAKAAATKRVYEEALDALGAVSPEAVVDPSSYFFFKAVAEHATMKRDLATNSIVRLLDDVTDAPDRYKMVATLMFFDMQAWAGDPKDLTNIEKLMDNSGRRLDLGRAGEKTQDIQKKIVFRLDELIKEMENKCKGGQCNGGNCPNGGSPGNGSTLQPNAPAPDSSLMGGQGAGKVDEKKLRMAAEVWGTLTAEKRNAIVEEINRDLPAKYKPMIDEYFKSLNRVHGIK